MKADIWNVLHDGSILEVSGTVPGDVQMAVWIEYLRNRFPDPGERIIVTLHGCSALSYKPFEEDETITVPRCYRKSPARNPAGQGLDRRQCG